MQPKTNGANPVGVYKRFGALGPAYQITGVAGEEKQKGILLNVRVLESGEELTYAYRDALDDPEA